MIHHSSTPSDPGRPRGYSIDFCNIGFRFRLGSTRTIPTVRVVARPIGRRLVLTSDVGHRVTLAGKALELVLVVEFEDIGRRV